MTTAFGAVIALLIGAAVVDPGQGHLARRYALAGVVLPLACVWLVSLRRPVFVDRYFLILLPWIAALAALGAQSLVAWSVRSTTRTWMAAPIVAAAIALAASAQIHGAAKYQKEDWRGVGGYLEVSGATPAALVLSEPELSLPLAYYGLVPSLAAVERLVPACVSRCWWILRQPYTSTHAFTQSISDSDRPWIPAIPSGCRRASVWSSPTGVQVWELACP